MGWSNVIAIVLVFFITYTQAQVGKGGTYPAVTTTPTPVQHPVCHPATCKFDESGVKVNPTSIALTWKCNMTVNERDFRQEEGPGKSPPIKCNGSSCTLNYTGLQAYTDYNVTIKHNCSVAMFSQTFKSGQGRPWPPSDIDVQVVNESYAEVTWQHNKLGTVDSFNIVLKSVFSNGTSLLTHNVEINSSQPFAYTFTDLKPENRYDIEITAKNHLGESEITRERFEMTVASEDKTGLYAGIAVAVILVILVAVILAVIIYRKMQKNRHGTKDITVVRGTKQGGDVMLRTENSRVQNNNGGNAERDSQEYNYDSVHDPDLTEKGIGHRKPAVLPKPKTNSLDPQDGSNSASKSSPRVSPGRVLSSPQSAGSYVGPDPLIYENRPDYFPNPEDQRRHRHGRQILHPPQDGALYENQAVPNASQEPPGEESDNDVYENVEQFEDYENVDSVRLEQKKKPVKSEQKGSKSDKYDYENAEAWFNAGDRYS